MKIVFKNFERFYKILIKIWKNLTEIYIFLLSIRIAGWVVGCFHFSQICQTFSKKFGGLKPPSPHHRTPMSVAKEVLIELSEYLSHIVVFYCTSNYISDSLDDKFSFTRFCDSRKKYRQQNIASKISPAINRQAKYRLSIKSPSKISPVNNIASKISPSKI